MLRFSDALHPRPAPRGIDIQCGLRHFAIITYAVDPGRLAGLMPSRFRLDTVEIDGRPHALLSVVPFVDVDFTSAVYPFPRFTMGQTNYRVYIVDQHTGERVVWFIGTTLDSWTLLVPRHIWNLPWHPGKVRFDCSQDPVSGLYDYYRMTTTSEWAPVEVEIEESKALTLPTRGFPDEETALVYLTHPLRGFYHRRDGRLGTYSVWHDRLEIRPARLLTASFGLLDRLGFVPFGEQAAPHSVLLQPLTEFTIYLPPQVI